MNASHNPIADANACPLGRSVLAFSETLESTGIDDQWMARACQGLAAHWAAELIVLEQYAGRPLSLQDAARFLADLSEAEVQP
jgi:hypothetical protein